MDSSRGRRGSPGIKPATGCTTVAVLHENCALQADSRKRDHPYTAQNVAGRQQALHSGPYSSAILRSRAYHHQLLPRLRVGGLSKFWN